MQLGFSHPIEYPAPNGINLAVDEKGTRITVSGFDKQLVGETASVVRRFKSLNLIKEKVLDMLMSMYVRKRVKQRLEQVPRSKKNK